MKVSLLINQLQAILLESGDVDVFSEAGRSLWINSTVECAIAYDPDINIPYEAEVRFVDFQPAFKGIKTKWNSDIQDDEDVEVDEPARVVLY